MKICPKCGGKKFIVTAHVTQDWIVDEDGCYIETVEPCGEVTHHPDGDDLWTCCNCGYDCSGNEFNTKKYNVTISYITSKTITVNAHNADKAIDIAADEIGSESNMSYIVEDENGRTVLDGLF